MKNLLFGLFLLLLSFSARSQSNQSLEVRLTTTFVEQKFGKDWKGILYICDPSNLSNQEAIKMLVLSLKKILT